MVRETEMATSRKSQEYKLTIINTIKTLRRPCTTLDLARSLKVKRTEINPYLYDLQKQGLIKKIQESNPPKWDLTGAGNMYGVRKGPTSTLGQNPAAKRGGCGRGILSFVSSLPLPHLGALNAQQSDYPVEKAIEGHSHIPISGIHSSAFQGETHSNVFHGQSMSPVTKSHSGLQLRIIQALEKASKPLTALEVANCVGLKTRKEVNPDLYALQKENVVSMDKSTGPPLWTLLRDKLAEVEGSSVCQGGGGVEKMELQSYSSSGVDLSQISQDDLSQRLLVVMQAAPGLKRTELELRNATETKASRMEVKTILESLLKEGKVQKTWTIPTKWWIPNPEGSKNTLYLNPNAPPFSPTGLFPLGATQVLPGGGTSHPATNQPHSGATPPLTSHGPSTEFTAAVINDMNKNPVSALMEFCQANKIDFSFVDVREFGPPHKKHFVIAAQLGTVRYEAESTSKKEAKRMAADLALQAIQQEQAKFPTTLMPANPSPSHAQATDAVPNTFSNKIAQTSHSWFTQVQRTIELPQPGRKVIAAFLMEDVLSGEMKVVSMGSGTRCITGDHMSLEGLVVNDSHAEVIARRSLMRFFYKQLFAYHQVSADDVDTIFVQDQNSNPGVLRVKENLKFHLYISTAPCGDGAQFSRGDDENRDPPVEDGHTPTMQGKLQGLLRTKMEGGEGTIPIGPDVMPLTWDGILHGGRLRTMSCSDKVGRWNVLGLQGSLLSLFMTPVYMASLTLGSLHHHGHLSRAVCCRFADVGGELPEGFMVNHPQLGRVQGGDEMRRHTEKTSNFSVNWALGDKKGELIDGGNGCPVQPPSIPKSHSPNLPSRVSKIGLYANFVKLAKACDRSELLSAKSYKEAKELSGVFQEAKQLLYKYCKVKGYGSWMRKPVEEEQFGTTVLERFKETLES